MIFDSVFTSVLNRASDTAKIIIDSLDSNLPGRNVVMIRHWRLVGRHYGALTGYNKAEMVDIYGKEQAQIWRRSNEVPPPPITEEHPFYKEIHENPSPNPLLFWWYTS